jgi:hypothetical protein
MAEGVIMSDRECGHSERAQFWLDIEWVDPPNADYDSSIVQAFIDKLSQAIKALPQREKK